MVRVQTLLKACLVFRRNPNYNSVSIVTDKIQIHGDSFQIASFIQSHFNRYIYIHMAHFLVTQECRLKRDLDTKSFGTRLETSFVENSHFDVPRFSSRSADHEFRVHHFAGSVCYRVEGLLKKNKASGNTKQKAQITSPGPKFRP